MSIPAVVRCLYSWYVMYLLRETDLLLFKNFTILCSFGCDQPAPSLKLQFSSNSRSYHFQWWINVFLNLLKYSACLDLLELRALLCMELLDLHIPGKSHTSVIRDSGRRPGCSILTRTKVVFGHCMCRDGEVVMRGMSNNVTSGKKNQTVN